tara:strand:+ start:866 stop:2353 length:1488 start_codon:yes stop_codon:yes gene_type:complete
MAILEQSQYDYYNNPSAFGNYQFTSLEDIINQFMVVYVGEEKIISKSSRTDIRFHAQRALAELSFDTFKSIKSQEIELPPSLTMPLPHDYVNYTRVLCVDNAGIKQPLYPTKHTQNPFKIKQDDNKAYDFIYPSDNIVAKGDFAGTNIFNFANGPWYVKNAYTGDTVNVVNEKLTFSHGSNSPVPPSNTAKTSRAYAVYQEIDVSNIDVLDFSAAATSAAAATGKGVGTVRIGFSTLTYPDYDPFVTNPNKTTKPSLNNTDVIFDIFTVSGTRALLTFNDGTGVESTSTLAEVDVSNETTVYLLITSFIENFTDTTLDNSENKVDDLVITCDALSDNLQSGGESTTWSSYKSNRPSENKQHDYDYDDHIFEANVGRRYGLDPAHAQDNGSYYVDNLRGKIHFSSNLSGKTIVLDYISDSLGTDSEMQVHKFAEEAMYKSIIYAILSTRINTPEYIIRRYKKERFAEIRKAKLRLSNIKLEEITQIFRGKSKQIKH